MRLTNVELTDMDKRYCEEWLASWKNIVRNLTQVNERQLVQLILYEATTRQRPDIIDRLLGRYNKIRRRRESREVYDFMKGHNERTRHREAS